MEVRVDCRLVLRAVFIVTFPTRLKHLAAGTAYGVFSTPVPFTVQTGLNPNRTCSHRSCREFDVIGVWNLNSSSNWTVTAASLRLSTTSTGVFGEISGTVGSFHPNIPIGLARLIPPSICTTSFLSISLCQDYSLPSSRMSLSSNLTL